MSRFPPLDLSDARLVSIHRRQSKVSADDAAQPVSAGMTVRRLIDSLPRQFAANDLRELISAVANAARRKRTVIASFGGHVVKLGLAPILIQLMERGVLSAVAMNGSASIHDFELAYCGRTSEDVEQSLNEGEFGMTDETGRHLHEALRRFPEDGMGKAVGRMISESDFPRADMSVLGTAYRMGIPATVHVAVGTDIVHQHPAADGARIGAATYADFLQFAAAAAQLEGGAILNFGSAVIMPEVFLKALSLARNLGHRVESFAAADFDMIRGYRPSENLVRRPTRLGGKGFHITGRHEIMIPLFAAALLDALENETDGETE